MAGLLLTKGLLLLVLLLCSGFFSGSETSLFSLGRLERYRLREADQTLTARCIAYLTQRPRRLIITILIGNDLINIMISAVAASMGDDLFHVWGVPDSPRWMIVETFAATAFCLPLLLVFGEITPKTLALRNPHAYARFAALPLRLFHRVVAPLRWVLAGLANGIVRLVLGRQDRKEEPITEREFRTLVDLGKQSGALWESEREFIHNIFDFGETRVSEIMTPRTDMFCVQYDQGLEEILTGIAVHHYSRIPVYKEDKDDVVGILYSKDLLQRAPHPSHDRAWKVHGLLRTPYFIPQTKKASDLFREFRFNRVHMAIVVDEYGGVAGLVTMEDLLEDLFGEIVDEYDPEEPETRQVDENTFIIPGGMPIEDCNRQLDGSLPEEDHDTMGGLVFDLFGRLPTLGARVSYMHYTFTVTKMLGKRILELRVQRQPEEVEAGGETSGGPANGNGGNA